MFAAHDYASDRLALVPGRKPEQVTVLSDVRFDRFVSHAFIIAQIAVENPKENMVAQAISPRVAGANVIRPYTNGSVRRPRRTKGECYFPLRYLRQPFRGASAKRRADAL